MNQQNRSKLIDTETIMMVARWERVGGMGDSGEGLKMCKLPVIKSHRDVKDTREYG